MSAPPAQDPTLRALEEAQNYNEWLLARGRPYLAGHVVDFGAGIGTFAEDLARVAERLTLVEPDPAFASALRDRFAGRESVRVVANGDDVAGDADAIVCFNVLEHIRDDGATLRLFHRLLRPGGHLLLLVPGHPSLYGEIDRAIDHFRRYRKPDLGRRLEDAGFEVRDLRRVNPVGAVGWLVWSRLLRRTMLPQRSLKLYDRLVPVFRTLDRIELPIGLSVWAVARRR